MMQEIVRLFDVVMPFIVAFFCARELLLARTTGVVRTIWGHAAVPADERLSFRLNCLWYVVLIAAMAGIAVYQVAVRLG